MTTSASGSRFGHRDNGQSTVEVALVLPVVALLMMAVVQIGVTVHDQVMVTHAAREAVRAAAVGVDADGIGRAARAGGGLDPHRLAVSTTGTNVRGEPVTARIEYTSVTDVPLIGPMLPDLQLTAEATMRRE